jgi:hypothetical protein
MNADEYCKNCKYQYAYECYDEFDRGATTTTTTTTTLKSSIKTSLSSFFSYKSTQTARIHSIKLGIFYRLIQFLIIYYILVWQMIRMKGYQLTDTQPVSIVTSRIRGVGFLSHDLDSKHKHNFVNQYGMFIRKSISNANDVHFMDVRIRLIDYLIETFFKE